MAKPTADFDSPYYPFFKVLPGVNTLKGSELIPYKIMRYLLDLPDAVRLLIMVPAGVLIYVGVSALLKLDSFTYVLEIAKRLLRRGKTAEGGETA